VLASIATASVRSSPVATPSSLPSVPNSSACWASSVGTLSPALERQGRRPPNAPFTGVRDRAKLNERFGLAGEDGLRCAKKSNAWALKKYRERD
jgi:hypothetical protein